MIASVKSLGLNVEIVTNGTLLNEEMAKGLIASGLDTLGFPLTEQVRINLMISGRELVLKRSFKI